MSDEYLTLKWGGPKSWYFNKTNERAVEAFGRWVAGGVSTSAAMNHPTDEQKQAICDLIDAGDFDTVYLDWDDKEVTKDEAKAYVMNYGKEVT